MGRESVVTLAPLLVVRHTGFEPVTSDSGDQCSIQLS